MRGSQTPAVKQCAKQNAEADQVFCLIASAGHLWMRGFFDCLPLSVRLRLRESAFNICPACLVIEALPTVRRQHPNWSREKLLFAAIEVMEAQVRQGKKNK
jgi:hypothetical protein